MTRALRRHLLGWPRRGRALRVPGLPRLAVARRVRRLGPDLRQPVRRPPGPDRVPQLGLGPPPGGDRSGRHRGRGPLPEHGPAVLLRGEPGGVAADRGGLRPPLGRPPGPQPLERRLLCRGTGPAVGRRPSLRQPHRRRRGRGAVGQGGLPAPGRRPVAVGAAELGPARPLGAALRPPVAGLRGARHPHPGPRRRRPARLRRARGGPGDDAHRAAVVRPSPGVAPDLLAACSSASRRCGWS